MGRRHRAGACTWRRSVPTPGIPTGRAPPGRAVVPKGDSRRTSTESRPVSHPAGEADRLSFVAGIATANRPSIPVDASGARCRAERRAGTLAIEATIDRRESRTGGRCRATSGAASGAPAHATAGAGRDSPRSRPLGVEPRRNRLPRPPDHARLPPVLPLTEGFHRPAGRRKVVWIEFLRPTGLEPIIGGDPRKASRWPTRSRPSSRRSWARA
jgi:hypothetical protein